jgi:hypothetical protein
MYNAYDATRYHLEDVRRDVARSRARRARRLRTRSLTTGTRRVSGALQRAADARS